jgi:uncharacterized protein (UPF0332 family)
VEAKSFLQLAHILSSMSDEAASRSAISRAYYSAHHTGVAFLKMLKVSIPDSGKRHYLTYVYLQNSGDPNLAIAGRKLADLYTERNDADYKLNETRFTNQELIEKWLDKAEEIIMLLDQDYSNKLPQIYEAINKCKAIHEGKPAS